MRRGARGRGGKPRAVLTRGHGWAAEGLLENARRHGGQGSGVAEEERERIFEPFHRPSGSQETGRGCGLGLALVRQIARAHGGEARCRAREGSGTAFDVDLDA